MLHHAAAPEPLQRRGGVCPPAGIFLRLDDDRVDESPGLVEVSDSHQIVGVGRNPEGSSRAFLLTPVEVPEPGSLALLGLGAAGLVGYAWKRRRDYRKSAVA